jgi:hypothetical protein
MRWALGSVYELAEEARPVLFLHCIVSEVMVTCYFNSALSSILSTSRGRIGGSQNSGQKEKLIESKLQILQSEGNENQQTMHSKIETTVWL